MEGILNVNFNHQYSPIVGQNIYIARPKIYSTIGLGAIVAYAAKAASIPQSDMFVTVEALLDAFTYFLCNGHSFKLDGVGTFSLSVRTKAGDVTEQDVITGADAITSVGINFLPCVEMKRALASVAVNTEATDENHLPEFIDPLCRSISFGGRSLNLIQPSSAVTTFATAGDMVVIAGYNFTEGMKVVLAGEFGGEQVTETLPLALLTKRAQIEVGAKCTKSYDAIRSIKLYDANDTLVVEYDYASAPIPTNATCLIGGVVISTGGNYPASNSSVVVTGRISGVVVEIDGVPVSPMSASGTKATYVNALSVGPHTIKVGETIWGINVVNVKTANITSLTANGETAYSGSSSAVVAGQSYNFVANGQNTELVKQTDIVVPAGATISNFSATATQVKFTLKVGSVGGTLKIANYTVTLVMQEQGSTAPKVTSCTEVAQGGTYTAQPTTQVQLHLTGENLADLTVSNLAVTGSGARADGLNATATSATLILITSPSGSANVALKNDAGATIWSCTINVATSGGDGDLEGPVL